MYKKTIEQGEELSYLMEAKVIFQIKAPYCFADITSQASKDVMSDILFKILKAGGLGYKAEMIPSNINPTYKISET